MLLSIVGPPGAGKTATVLASAAALEQRGLKPAVVTEVARTYLVKAGPDLHSQFVVSQLQKLAEEEYPQEYVLSDSAPFVPYVYARYLLPEEVVPDPGAALSRLLTRMHELAVKTARGGRKLFFARYLGKSGADLNVISQLSRAILGFMDAEGISYQVLPDELERRVEVICAAVN